MENFSLSKRAWLLILAAVLAAWFCNLEYRKLMPPDEGRYAEIPREMVASGDWVTPRLDGFKYFEKPALQYWATAAAYEIFGVQQWTSRLWTALTGLLGIAAVVFCGWHVFGREAGNYAGMILGSSFLYAGAAHFDSLDMGVTAFMTVNLCAFLLAQRDGVSSVENRNWMWLAWAAAALAMLSKGLQAVVLPGAVFVLYTIVERDFRMWKKIHAESGIVIFLAITVPWFVAVSASNPEFPKFFFWHEHVERFFTKVHGRYQPWWFFVPVLIAGTVPWAVLIIEGLIAAWHRQPDKRFQPQRFLLMWAVFIFVFFSVSDSKLAAYILPIFPALALLAGAHLTRLSITRFRIQVLPMLLVAVAIAVWAANAERAASDEVPAALYRDFALWLYAAAALLACGTVGALIADGRGQRELAVILLAAAGLAFEQVGGSGVDALSPAMSSYHLLDKAKPELALLDLLDRPEVPFYSVGFYDQTVPFYAKRTLILVEYKGELEFGIGLEPKNYIPTVAEFATRWRADRRALAIMQPDRYRELAAAGLPMRLIAEDTRRVLVVKPQGAQTAPAAPAATQP